MSKEDNIPPMIHDWIVTLFDAKTPVNVRENYRDNLERVSKLAMEAVQKFDREKYRRPLVVK